MRLSVTTISLLRHNIFINMYKIILYCTCSVIIYDIFFFFWKNYRDERKLIRELEREPIDDDIIYWTYMYIYIL